MRTGFSNSYNKIHLHMQWAFSRCSVIAGSIDFFKMWWQIFCILFDVRLNDFFHLWLKKFLEMEDSDSDIRTSPPYYFTVECYLMWSNVTTVPRFNFQFIFLEVTYIYMYNQGTCLSITQMFQAVNFRSYVSDLSFLLLEN